MALLADCKQLILPGYNSLKIFENKITLENKVIYVIKNTPVSRAVPGWKCDAMAQNLKLEFKTGV